MALREMLAQFSIVVDGLDQVDKAHDKLSKFTGMFDGIAGSLRLFGVVSTVAAAGALALVPGLIETGNELDKVADRLGFTTEELQRWRYMAEQTGAKANDLTLAVKFLYRNLADAAQGGAASKQFAKLGINVRNSSGEVKTAEEAMGDLADAVGKAKSDAEKAGIALHFLGKGGIALLPLLKGGREGVEKLTARFKELGSGLSDEFVHDAAAAKAAQIDLSYATLRLKDHIGVQLLPTVTWITHKLADLSVVTGKVVHNTQTMKTIMLGAGAASTITAVKLGAGLAQKLGLVKYLADGASKGVLGTIRSFIGLGASAANLALKLALVFLVLEDLFTWFEGGKSVFGDALDTAFGPGASEKVRAFAHEALPFVKEALLSIIPVLQWLATQTALFLKDMFHGFDGYGTMFKDFFHFLAEDIKKLWDRIVQINFDGIEELSAKLDKFRMDHPILDGLIKVAGASLNPAGAIVSSGTAAGAVNNIVQHNQTSIEVNGNGVNPQDLANKVLSGQADVQDDHAATMNAIVRP